VDARHKHAIGPAEGRTRLAGHDGGEAFAMTTAPESASAKTAEPRASFLNAVTIYLRPRVLVVLFLGFSSGLPLALSGTTLQAWMKTSNVDIRTIGLFAAVGIPYSIKFLWAPLTDAFDVPFVSPWLGRRRGWLILSQLLLIVAVVFLAFCDPAAPGFIALAALMVATASATQDIVVDAFRVESLPEDEQAAGMASYVAAYRVGMLVSGAGALVLVDQLQAAGYSIATAWTGTYLAMAALVTIGIITTVFAREPSVSAKAEVEHARERRENPLGRAVKTAVNAFVDFLSHDMAVVILAFVALFKLADALSSSMNTPFFLQIGFSLGEIAAISKGIGFAAMLLGGFAGGAVARALPLGRSLWIGGLLQTLTILLFSAQAVVGHNLVVLAFTVSIWNFADAFGTVIFVAYLSALCQNPLHTATQYALLTALTAVGRTIFSSGMGYVVAFAGFFWYFAICTALAAPGLLLLAFLQSRGHFKALQPKRS
jgi:PAT family beta-lactamase induction signal transducer AmpG